MNWIDWLELLSIRIGLGWLGCPQTDDFAVFRLVLISIYLVYIRSGYFQMVSIGLHLVGLVVPGLTRTGFRLVWIGLYSLGLVRVGLDRDGLQCRRFAFVCCDFGVWTGAGLVCIGFHWIGFRVVWIEMDRNGLKWLGSL